MQTPDLLWLSKAYESFEIPKEKKYLFKYFKTQIQQAFVRYFFAFGTYTNFKDHTGLDCQMRWLNILHRKLEALEKVRHEARANMDMTTLAKIEAGKYKF